MPKRFKYTQVVLESLIPLLGFFLWNWGLYFILLFYFIDLFADHIMTHLKSKRIVAYKQEGKETWMKQGLIGAIILCVGIVVTHFAVQAIEPRIDFIKEVVDFWTYKEMGIQQGYILAPLVLVMAYQQYKMDFLRLQKFQSTGIKELWGGKIQAKVLILSFAALVLASAQFIILPEWAYVIGIVVVASIYSLFVKD